MTKKKKAAAQAAAQVTPRSMAELRWAGATAAERKEVGQALNAARNRTLTPEQRSEIARQAGFARAKKAGQKLRKKKKKK